MKLAVFLALMTLLALTACGADGPPARPSAGVGVGIGTGGVSAGGGVGLSNGTVSVGIGL
ncbi:hypothetical protein [Rubellimicrobium arenae]|uniref:hypothetical protein n=1 Tax=Rubellimicrobium arenae TaxID=2817372 RepID=UPI001B302B8B|nr:hypothetical protein [Rubellimicrobium arenae]